MANSNINFTPSPETEKLFPFSIYLVTCGTTEEAEKISSTLLNEKLIACANIIGGAEKSLFSIYTWQNKVEKDPELQLVMKSRTELLDEIVESVNKVHSYDVPEVIAQPILGGSKEYLKWVLENTKEPGNNEPTKQQSEL